MPYDPLTRTEAGAPLTTAQHDNNWTTLATAVNHGGYYTPTFTGGTERTVRAGLVERSVSVKDFGATGDGSTDDTTAIQNAINAGPPVFVPAGTYRHNTLTLRSGLQMMGEGSGRSFFRRLTNVVGWQGIGTGVDFGLSVRYVQLTGMSLNGHDFTADLMQLQYFMICAFTDVEWVGVGGRGIWCGIAAQDFRFYNCHWEYCGSADGTVPVIELAGTNVLPPNQIHWFGCRWESNRAESVKTTSTNANELFFIACKMENLNLLSSKPMLSLNNATMIYFAPLQLTLLMPPGATEINGLVEMTACEGVSGTILGELPGATANMTKNVLYITGACEAFDLAVALMGGAGGVSEPFLTRVITRSDSLFIRSMYSWPGGSRNGMSLSNRLEGGVRIMRRQITAAPTFGQWLVGDTVERSVPAAGATPAWICTVAGGSGVAWASGQNLVPGAWITTGGRVYLLVAKVGTGTTTTAPTHTSGEVVLNNYTWRWMSSTIATWSAMPNLV